MSPDWYTLGMDGTLAEELLLIAYNDTTGRSESGSTELDCGLAGALLVELTLARRIDIVDGKVVVMDPAPTGDALVDGALTRIAGEQRARKPDWWVGKLKTGVRDELLARLTKRGVLQMQRRKVWKLFPVRRYPTLDAGIESAARSRLQSVVGHGTQPDARTAALASLLDACGLARRTFPDLDRKQLKLRMKELGEGQWTSDAVRKAIQSIQAGVAAASVATSAAVIAST
jgi:Golgi phosphoprotein 3 GPP34